MAFFRGRLGPNYFQRIFSSAVRGAPTRQAARGHRDTPEHPERAFQDAYRWQHYLRRLSERRPLRPREERALARLNDARIGVGKAPLVIGRPPDPGPGVRQLTVDTLEEAENHTAGPPPDYTAIYIWADGFTAEKRSAVKRSRRRAA